MVNDSTTATHHPKDSSQPARTVGDDDLTLRRKLVKSLIASGIGNILEWFDWGIYAVLSPYIAAAVFSPKDPTSALLSTLGVFAVGFVVRPIGGLVFGAISNRIGRKNVLLITMLLTALGSLVIAIVPGYGTLGVWAAVILVVARLGQGFGLGGESATTYTYIGEIAPARRRGLWGSVVFVGLVLGSVLAFGVSAALTATFSSSDMASWGWRLPFVLGAFLAAYALFLRRGMVESIEVSPSAGAQSFEKTIKSGAQWSTGKVVRTTIKLVFLVSGLTAVQYAWISSASTIAITQKGMAPETAFGVMLVAELLLVVALPFWGRLSDTIGRKPMFIISAAVLAVLQFPLSSMLGSSALSLLVPVSIVLLVFAMAASVATSTLSEAVPTRHRAVVIGIATSLSVALFGGTAPYLQALFVSFHVAWLFNAYVVLLLCGTLIAAITLKERKGIELADVA